MSLLDDDQYQQWKTTLVPLIYDWFSNHNLDWPSQTCRWGPLLEEATYKCKYRVYLSEQTDDSEPQKLKIVNADVCKPRVAASEAVSYWKDMKQSPYIKDYKIIFHPGEVNKIREVPQHQHLVVTHTDSPNLYVWNIDKQPNRTSNKGDKKKAAPSVADLMLVGHEKDAQFPLSTCSSEPMVASGGQDNLVLLWNLQDSMESVLAGAGSSSGDKESPTLAARTRLEGHTETVEDVVFKPGSSQELASVGDDHQLLLWDTRNGTVPVLKVEGAHGDNDIHCVDWSSVEQHLIATGAADGSLSVWDFRKMAPGQELHTFRVHREAIMRLEWHPTQSNVLASGGDDRRVLVWDLTRDKHPGQESAKRPRNTDNPPELLFQHIGHRNGKVVDFQWNPSMPWTMLSVSDNTESEDSGGGTLQMWRVQDLIHRPDEEVLQELEAHREFVLHGTTKKPSKPKAAADAAPASAEKPVPNAEAPASTSGAAAEAPAADAEANGTEAEAAAAPADAGGDTEMAPAEEEAVAPAAEAAADADAPAEEAVLEAPVSGEEAGVAEAEVPAEEQAAPAEAEADADAMQVDLPAAGEGAEAPAE